MADKLKEAITFQSGQSPKSDIFKTSWNGRLSSIFGWKGIEKKNAQTEFEKVHGLRFVKVDVGNDNYRIKHAALGSIYKSAPLSTTLDKYFEKYVNETTLLYDNIYERQQRLNELRFAVLNDPFLSRVCQLVADEATQLDDQNRLLSIESPSIAFVNKCYELFSQWGLTQQRISSACYDIEQYGEALWAHRVTERGVERIIPLKVSALKERLEFSPAHMAEVVAQMEGEQKMLRNRSTKIDSLVHMLTSKEGKELLSDYDQNFADTFDSKLLGFEFDDGIIVPPWLVTHFRYRADNSEFFPYGTPPLLMALAPFRQCYSTMALQGLARASSFPVQIYKVKTVEGMGPAQAFETVNQTREEYDNIGVTPMSNSLEVYTVNTKIWVPDGLLEFETKESKVDMDFTGDLEMFQDRVAIACGVPKAYLDQEFGGFGNSGISLVEQYKPFARHVYTIQSSFLDSLGQLIRLHFAITGEFDYNIPFVLSMRFPAEDMGDEKREARTASVDLANSIIELLQGVLGMEEGEPLPEDVVADILGKYTFLDPTELQRWIRLSAIAKAAAAANSDGEEGEGGAGGDDGGGDGGMDMGDGGDMDMGDGGDDGGDGGDAPMAESMSSEERKYYLETKKHLKEKVNQKLVEAKLRRLNEISLRYKESKDDLYFQFLKEHNFQEWQKPSQKVHELLVPPINSASLLYETFKVLTTDAANTPSKKLNEEVPLNDMMKEYKDNKNKVPDITSEHLREYQDERIDEMISDTKNDIITHEDLTSD